MHLAPIFSDGMILQADKPIRIFGEGGGQLHIELAGQVYDENIIACDWCIELPALPYGGPYELKAELDGHKKIVKDVYIGDVYLLSGQSNMEFKLHESDYPKDDYQSFPNMRLFTIERMESGEAFAPEDGWVSCTKENAGDWSCIGYIVGQYLMQKRDTAVGFIACYQGAAQIETFMPDRIFEKDGFTLPDAERSDQQHAWNHGHSVLYDFMVKKMVPYSLAAVLWYQGESNTNSVKEASIYEAQLNALIDTWREDMKDEALHFIIIQIADFLPSFDDAWRIVQQAQLNVGQRENIDTVICSDVCEKETIHPTKKTELSRRIAELL